MTATLQTILRDKVGSRDARKLRIQGKIPVIVQGDGAHVNAAIDQEEFLSARRHHEHVFELALPSGGETTMVRELQWDALGETITHVEFQRVDLKKETEAEVHVSFIGIPKEGVLNQLMTHVTVAAIPALIPDEIEVNVSELEPGHPIFAGDLPCPEGVRMVTEADQQVAVASTVRAEAEPEEEAEEGAEGEAAAAEKPEGEDA